ncbi:MAG: helix-turn-helix domain-containing protein [Daejeonella sp.]
MKKELGIVIASCRKQHQFKQDYMAFKLEITPHAYANIEHGRSDISSVKLAEISKLFGLKPHHLIILAEEIIDVGRTDWLYDVVKGMVRLSTVNHVQELTAEDIFLLRMNKSMVDMVIPVTQK